MSARGAAARALTPSRWHLPVLAVLAFVTFVFLDRAYARATAELTLRQADAAQEFAVAYLGQIGPISDKGGALFAGPERIDDGAQIAEAVKEASGFGCAIYRGRQRVEVASSAPDGAARAPVPEDAAALAGALTGLSFRGVTRDAGRDWFV
ncbi:MAG TPA: hypothetical protein VHB21_12815, partial [Minicystis sp.]|nr:hypothetical protein [Minicystis sp.]